MTVLDKVRVPGEGWENVGTNELNRKVAEALARKIAAGKRACDLVAATGSTDQDVKDVAEILLELIGTERQIDTEIAELNRELRAGLP